MQIVVAERGRAENPRVGQQERVLVDQFRKLRIGARVTEGRKRCLGSLVVPLRRGQTGFQELRPPRVSTGHLCHFGAGQQHLRRGLRHHAGGNPGIDGQAVADTPDEFLRAVIRTPDEVDLTKLRKDFQHEIVPVGLDDLGHQRHQQIPRRDLVGGEYQVTGALQFARDRHGCIISPMRRKPERRTRE